MRQSHFLLIGENRTLAAMDEGAIRAALRRLGVPHRLIGEAIGASRDSATRLMDEDRPRRIRVDEREPLLRLIAKYERDRGESEVSRDLHDYQEEFETGLVQSYVSVEVLPTYAGMGGAGTGEDDRRRALLPRALVEDELHATPEDILVIQVRGTSMEPEFKQGDQVVVDKRDTDTHQPGPFAIWYDDGYVLKNLERVPRTNRLRVFSTNPTFSDREEEGEHIRIVGRPVWYARRL